jgi:hypothetical protein
VGGGAELERGRGEGVGRGCFFIIRTAIFYRKRKTDGCEERSQGMREGGGKSRKSHRRREMEERKEEGSREFN